jgi:hypothetical protein
MLWEVCGASAIGPTPPICAAYIAGASDGALNGATQSHPFCAPRETDADELAQAVRQYMSAHPDRHTELAVTVVTAALEQAYPCLPR